MFFHNPLRMNYNHFWFLLELGISVMSKLRQFQTNATHIHILNLSICFKQKSWLTKKICQAFWAYLRPKLSAILGQIQWPASLNLKKHREWLLTLMKHKHCRMCFQYISSKLNFILIVIWNVWLWSSSVAKGRKKGK